MTGRTEERLRDATAAFGGVLRREDIGELRLPPRRERASWRQLPPGGPRRLAPRTRLLVPLAAAGAVLALIGSLIVAGRLLRGAAPVRPAHSTSPAPVTSPLPGAVTAPAYLVTAVQGHGFVRSAATGRLVASLKPPVRNFSVEGIAMGPGDRTVYLAGAVPQASSGLVRIEFFALRLGPHGVPGPARALPGEPLIVPLPITSDGLMTLPLAVSPDGRYLAYPSDNQFYPGNYAARHPAAITVLNLVTGTRRTWAIWPDQATQLAGVSWGSAGLLGIVATLGHAAVSGGKVVPRAGFQVIAFLMLDTGSAGHNLASASRVLLADQSPEGNTGGPGHQPAVVGGILSPDGRSAYVLRTVQGGAAELVRVSTPAGKLTRVLVTRPAEPVRADPLAIDGRYLLVALGPSRPPTPASQYVCGHLAAIRLPAGRPEVLPVPIACSTVAPPPPLQATW